ncbi:MAG TPA: alpha/beta hydrolase [Burkholderiales bacterium]|nr:alpha/beta hydrolase [Burkholderiales bacterium]
MRLASSHARASAPSIVFLHEGLGSVSMWRDFPQRVADATGCEAVVYSRQGHGRSDPLSAPRSVRYMHDEALIVLPELLERLHIERPILLGHSDGASIALLHAGGAANAPTAVIAMAPHVMVEDIAVESIAQSRVSYETTDMRRRLSRHHADADATFWSWNRIWLDPAFRDWNIEHCLPRIPCPILAMQGEDDEYGSMEQIERIARQARDVEVVKLADCRHSPHKDQPDAALAAIEAFVGRVLEEEGPPQLDGS